MIFLDLADLLAVAEVALEHPAEVRDYGLLESAIGRPQATVFGEDAYPTIDGKAAALLHSIACNHPLIDGNKRLALAAALLFYEMNGVRIRPTPDAFDLMVEVASGQLRDIGAIADRLAAWPRG